MRQSGLRAEILVASQKKISTCKWQRTFSSSDMILPWLPTIMCPIVPVLRVAD